MSDRTIDRLGGVTRAPGNLHVEPDDAAVAKLRLIVETAQEVWG